ncbi:MAG: flagellar filament capping protein FliD [Alicyclobacillus macrosporangiidus]|uniref:flagellar filament capping protein FliD n=1 Tax=Alicyclobacillus macrosporangiidus TaxID=392015 RepID=UPI0026E9E5B7|nr:flagellar filament capping protein FliD [Alicyclobacillus macrosporangiidus]MCL6598703.1 flagellar filament capping protein FliD [Alicyclobacillus macrosporangiidus]
MSLNLGGMQALSLMSGTIDYSQIVQQLYQVARQPGDALNQTIQTLQLKQNDWSNIASLAGKLQDALVTLADTSTFSSFTTSVGGTDANAITATASTSAAPGTYNITVTAGSAAVFTSSSGIGAAPTMSTALSSQVFSQPVTAGSVTVTVGNISKTISVSGTDTLQSVIDNINTAFGSTVISGASITGNQLTFTNASGQTLVFGSAGDTSNLFQVIGLDGVQVAGGANGTSGLLGHVQLTTYLQSANFATSVTATNGDMKINNVDITYNAQTDTLQGIINKINSSAAGVTASYNPLTDEITLTSKTSQPITVSDVTGNLAAALNIAGTSPAGKPWSYTINGTSGTSAGPTVSNVIPGVTFTIQSSGSCTLTVAQDTDVLTKNVQAFVDAFNTLYKQLQTYTQKGGDLQGDAAMAQLAFKYMNDVLSNGLPGVAPQYANLTVQAIGINNGAVGSAPGTTNSLQVNTNALVQAFQNDPNQVQSLLTGMATKLNSDLTNLTGQFNNLTPISPSNMNMVGIAQSEQNMYSKMISDTLQQQQTIYDQAQAQAQQLMAQFQQLQQYQAQAAMEQAALRGLFSITG